MRRIIVGAQVSMDAMSLFTLPVVLTALDSPSDREVARQARMKREG